MAATVSDTSSKARLEPVPEDGVSMTTTSLSHYPSEVGRAESVASSYARAAARVEKEAKRKHTDGTYKAHWTSENFGAISGRKSLDKLQSARAIEAIQALQTAADKSKETAGTARLAKGWAQVAVAAEKAARLRYYESRHNPQSTESIAPITVGSKVTYFSREKKEYVEAVVVGPYDPFTGTYNLNINGMAHADQVFKEKAVPQVDNAQKLKEIFHMCDINKDGHVSLFELETIIKNDAATAEFFGITGSDDASMREERINNLFGSMDESSDECLTWPEFCVWGNRQDELKAIFDRCDIDKDGSLTMSELSLLTAKDATVARYFNIPIEDKEDQKAKIRELFQTVDQNGDDKLSWAEFRIWNARNQAAIEEVLPKPRFKSVWGAICSCGTLYQEEDRFCRKCGAKRDKESMSAPSNLLPPNLPLQNDAQIKEDKAEASPKSMMTILEDSSSDEDQIQRKKQPMGRDVDSRLPGRSINATRQEAKMQSEESSAESSGDERQRTKKINSLGVRVLAPSDELYNAQVAKLQATIQTYNQKLNADITKQVKAFQREWSKMSSQASLTSTPVAAQPVEPKKRMHVSFDDDLSMTAVKSDGAKATESLSDREPQRQTLPPHIEELIQELKGKVSSRLQCVEPLAQQLKDLQVSFHGLEQDKQANDTYRDLVAKVEALQVSVAELVSLEQRADGNLMERIHVLEASIGRSGNKQNVVSARVSAIDHNTPAGTVVFFHDMQETSLNGLMGVVDNADASVGCLTVSTPVKDTPISVKFENLRINSAGVWPPAHIDTKAFQGILDACGLTLQPITIEGAMSLPDLVESLKMRDILTARDLLLVLHKLLRERPHSPLVAISPSFRDSGVIPETSSKQMMSTQV